MAAGLCSTVAMSKFISEKVETKTLVLLDNWATIETHSIFFDHLRSEIGHQVEFAMADVGPPVVKLYDSFFYDNIILMAPSFKESEIAKGLKVDDFMEFFETQGHNLMIFADIDARRHVRRLATNFGVDLENYVSTYPLLSSFSNSLSSIAFLPEGQHPTNE